MTLLAFRTPASALAAGPDSRTIPGPAAAAAPAPRLTSTVAKEYVHRACHAEVFITGSEQLTDTAFAVTAQWRGRTPSSARRTAPGTTRCKQLKRSARPASTLPTPGSVYRSTTSS